MTRKAQDPLHNPATPQRLQVTKHFQRWGLPASDRRQNDDFIPISKQLVEIVAERAHVLAADRDQATARERLVTYVCGDDPQRGGQVSTGFQVDFLGQAMRGWITATGKLKLNLHGFTFSKTDRSLRRPVTSGFDVCRCEPFKGFRQSTGGLLSGEAGESMACD